MADDAFALSPISARGTLPSESDYEAIRDAFMETARGRWFLSEYAIRNRNADTTAVLDAVARLERALEQQKQTPAITQPQAESASLEEVMAVFVALRAKVEAAANTGLIEKAAVPLRDSARIIQEIAWGLRESGSDSRICDLLDSQITAINLACDQLSAAGISNGDTQPFDEAFARLDELAGHPGGHRHDATPAAADNHSAPPINATTSADVEPVAKPPETIEAPIFQHEIVEQEIVVPAAAAHGNIQIEVVEFKAIEPEAVELEAVEQATVEPTPVELKTVEQPVESEIGEIAAAEPKAMEPDRDGPIAIESVTANIDPRAERATATDVVETEPATMPSPVIARGPMIRFQEPEPAVEQVAVVDPKPENKLDADIPKTNVSIAPQSLGASILANGIVAVSPARPDPLAPLKRMSQAEKIAFFS